MRTRIGASKRRHPAKRARLVTLMISLAAMAGYTGTLAAREATATVATPGSPSSSSDQNTAARATEPSSAGTGSALPSTNTAPGTPLTSSGGS